MKVSSVSNSGEKIKKVGLACEKILIPDSMDTTKVLHKE